MTLGLINAPAVFQGLVNDVLWDLLNNSFFVYLNDMTIVPTPLPGLSNSCGSSMPTPFPVQPPAFQCSRPGVTSHRSSPEQEPEDSSTSVQAFVQRCSHTWIKAHSTFQPLPTVRPTDAAPCNARLLCSPF